ncbi:PilZ domain-containing protein [Mariprofundus ferrinatatus]|uniref:PilZ domain-containing protein n=1 Tax=Mariprofundus ferrinatatus TaxID=1921087 RepID=A0A2K8L9H9_9PROT|nr:PilZ domain-containing protein [Mariprofundus ferrinatatus]ATX82909.1 PilZ domain-containing protein [Mariprofundus ferrinatatus]
MSKDEGRKLRETFRQDEVLAINIELLTFDQFRVEMNKSGVVSHHTRMMQEFISHESGSDRYGSGLSPEIAGALEALDQKLNYLISLHMDNSRSKDSKFTQQFVNLSATGIGFSAPARKFKKDDRLKITMKLPLFPPIELELIGKVVSVKANKENLSEVWVGVAFLQRSDLEEDMLIKYLFKRQRERLRAKELTSPNKEELLPGI